MANQSQSNQPEKGKGVILREAVSFLAGVYLLLLSPDQSCAVTATWYANVGDCTTGYNIYYRMLGVQEWEGPVVINGIETTVATFNVPPGTWEATITAWSDYCYGGPIAYIESDMAPVVQFIVEPETCVAVPLGLEIQY